VLEFFLLELIVCKSLSKYHFCT